MTLLQSSDSIALCAGQHVSRDGRRIEGLIWKQGTGQHMRRNTHMMNVLQAEMHTLTELVQASHVGGLPDRTSF